MSTCQTPGATYELVNCEWQTIQWLGMIRGYVLDQNSLMKISNVNAYYCAYCCALSAKIPQSAGLPWIFRILLSPGRLKVEETQLLRASQCRIPRIPRIPWFTSPGLPWLVAVACKTLWKGRMKPWRSACSGFLLPNKSLLDVNFPKHCHHHRFWMVLTRVRNPTAVDDICGKTLYIYIYIFIYS